MPIDRKSLGKRLRQQRKTLDLTQAEVGERAGLETAYVSQVERGQRLLSLEALVRIAKALKVNAGTLLDGGEMGKDDPLLREVRAVLAKWDTKKRRAILKALRALADL